MLSESRWIKPKHRTYGSYATVGPIEARLKNHEARLRSPLTLLQFGDDPATAGSPRRDRHSEPSPSTDLLTLFAEALRMFGLSMTHIIILLIVGVLLFGKRLPEVARSVGKMLVELKKSWAGLEDQLTSGSFFEEPRNQASAPPPPPARPPQRIQPTGPKFEDAPGENPPPSSPIV